MQSERNAILLSVVIFASSALTAELHAVERSRSVSYVVDEWQVKDGLPAGGIRALAQTPDGYLWVSTAGGLARFDGVRFSLPVELKNGLGADVILAHDVIVARDGGLWIGAGDSLSRIKDGKCSIFKEPTDIACLEESADGSIWLGHSWAGLSRLRNGRFINYRAVTGLIRAIHEDRNGNIWLGGIWDGLYRLNPDGALNCVARDETREVDISAIAEDPAGNVWVGTRRGLHRYADGTLIRVGDAEPVTSLLVDRAGRIWVGGSSGSVGVITAGRIQKLAEIEGRLEDDVTCLFEDREGGVWIGTSGGLLRVREGRFRLYTKQDGLAHNKAASMVAGRDETVWVFSDGGGVSAIRPGGSIQVFTEKEGLASNYGGSLFESRDGSIWAGTANGLSRIKNGKVTSYSGGRLAQRFISAIFEDEKSLVVSLPSGLFRFDAGELRPYAAGGLPGNTYIYQAYADKNGVIWLATGNGLFTVSGQDSVIRRVDVGLPDNNVHSVELDSDGALWLATGKIGIARLKDGRLSTLNTTQGLYDNRVTRILPDDFGNLWMACPRGVFRVRRKEIDDYASQKIRQVESIAYGAADGMKSSECSHGFQTPGCRTPDGLLWFPTQRGVLCVDPSPAKLNRLPPPVAIEQLVVDGREIPPEAGLELRPGDRRIEFHFTGLSLRVPEKVRFKYRLEGFDQEWLQAGNRRTAYYTNIPPGRYTFRVIAANDDGVWNETGASLDFRMKPHFYQTPYFVGLMVAVLALGAAGGYRLRMAGLRKRYLAVLEERHRIARDMHDTFAQNLGGVALQLDGIKMQFTDIPPALSQKLDQTTRMIRYSLADAYRSVRDLRAQILESRELAEALPEVGAQTTAGSGVALDVRVTGTPRKLTAAAEDNVLRIFQEIMANAVKHARAKSIQVELKFEAESLALRVADDGCGFDAEKAFSLGDGHYGLLGMRERVDRVGGRMELTSRPGAGTVILIEVPTRLMEG